MEDVTGEVGDSIIWQNNFLPHRGEAAENVDTTVYRAEHFGYTFLVKRRDRDSDKQMLTEIVVVDGELWGDDTGERCITKHTKYFEDAELRSIMRAYAMGRRHEQERLKEIVRDGEQV